MDSSQQTLVVSGHAFTYLYDSQLGEEEIPSQLDTEAAKSDAEESAPAYTQQLALPPIPPIIPPVGTTVIESLISHNQDVWDLLLQNKFCSEGYVSTASKFNPKYQFFSKQDYLYLIEYVRLVTYQSLQEPYSRTEAGLNIMVEDLKKKVGYVKVFFDTCVNKMGIKADELKKERFSQPVLGYTAWLQLSAVTDDAFSIFIRLIPCKYGWNQIAHKLKNQRDTPQKETYFYKYWFLENIKDKSAKKLSKYLEDHRKEYECSASWKKWNNAFRQACLFEIAFFEAGLKGSSPTFFAM